MADRVSKHARVAAQPHVETVPFEPTPVYSAIADAPLLLRTHEAAQLLQISERKLYYLAKDGTIPVVRFGRSVRFSKAALLRYIAQQEWHQQEVR